MDGQEKIKKEKPKLIKSEIGRDEYICTKCGNIGLQEYVMMNPIPLRPVPHRCESCDEVYELPLLNEE